MRAEPRQSELFDLPLDPDVETSELDAGELGGGEVEGPPSEASGPADLPARLYAGCVDLLVHSCVLLVVLAGLRGLGVTPTAEHVVPLGLLLVVFSLFYTVIPLVFWSATPGMRLRGLVTYGEDGDRLTLSQAVGRWATALATVASAGLLLALAADGRSLGDRFTGSTTVVSGV